MTSYNLAGRTALVTGGASGIGLAVTTQIARNGGTVAVNFLPDDPRGEETVARLQADGLIPTEPAPKKLSKSDLAGTRRVITFCALPDDYAGRARIEHWDDDLPVSENFGKARDRLIERIRRLLEELKDE